MVFWSTGNDPSQTTSNDRSGRRSDVEGHLQARTSKFSLNPSNTIHIPYEGTLPAVLIIYTFLLSSTLVSPRNASSPDHSAVLV